MTPQQTNPFKVGDRIRSIAYDNPIQRPYGSKFTVVKVFGTDVYYMDGYAAHYSKFELVQSTKPMTKYPLFVQHRSTGEIIKYTNLTTGITIHQGIGKTQPGYTSENRLPHTRARYKPCDFTIEPEIFDIDWWGARFEAGLDVWYCLPYTYYIKSSTLPSILAQHNKEIKFSIKFIEDAKISTNVSSTTKTTTQKEPPMKTPKLFRIFDKNKKPNIPGIFHQLHKFGNIDPRPFVQQLIKDEQTRIFEALQHPHPCLNNYNIKLTYACQKLDEMSTFTDPYIEVTPEHILAYYLYQKEINNQTNYSWIASYLNHYYMSSPERVVLFHSNHRYIYIENGYLTLEESNNTYSVPIQYDSTSNTFYI